MAFWIAVEPAILDNEIPALGPLSWLVTMAISKKTGV